MTSVQQIFNLALEHHQADNLQQAELAYRQILYVEPWHADAWHMLGVLAHQVGRNDLAIDYITHALRLQPTMTEAYSNLGLAYKAQGRLNEAIASYREAICLRPNYVKAHNNLGIALKAQGRLEQAISSFQQAIYLDSDYAEAHNNLGIALAEQGKFEEATACYQRALHLMPDYAEAHNNLGIAFKEQGKLEQAIASYQQALRLQPDSAEAHNNLGNALAEHEAFDDAIGCYQQALNLKPHYAEALNNLGSVLKDAGMLEEVIACFRRALHLRPDFAHAHNNLGDALLNQGNVPDAVACFREALRLMPDFARAWWRLGQVVDLGNDEIDRLHTLLADSQPSRRDRSELHRTLAVCFDRRRDYDAAFSHLRQANDLRKQELQQTGRDFDATKLRALVDRQIETFDESFFRRERPTVSSTEIPVFVVGMPRSGTTLVEQILSSHSKVFGAGELYDVAKFVSTLERANASSDSYPACLQSLEDGKLRKFVNRYLARLTQMGGGAARVIDKMPGNFVHLGLIALLFPRARIIHCRRDPLDVCLSCYFQDFSRVNYSWSLEDLGVFYREYERSMAHWRRVLPVRMVEVRYEDLVARQETISRELIAFCGLEWEDSCLSFHKNTRPVQTSSVLQVRQPLYATSIGRWQNYEVYLEPLRRALGPPGPLI